MMMQGGGVGVGLANDGRLPIDMARRLSIYSIARRSHEEGKGDRKEVDAAAPQWRQRRPTRTGAEAAGVVGVAVEEGEGGDRDSNWSLMVDLPSLDSIVKETFSPATSNSSNKLKRFWNSGFIFIPDI